MIYLIPVLDRAIEVFGSKERAELGSNLRSP